MALPQDTYSQEVITDDWLNEIARLATYLSTIATGGGASDYTLTSDEYQCRTLAFTGVLTGARNIIVPAEAGRWWIVKNDTTGSFSLTVKTSGGAGVVVPQGSTVLLRTDGTDVLQIAANPATRPVEAHTTDDTLTAAETGSVHTTVGAGGTVVLTLPVAAVGLEFYFRVGAAHELRLEPNGSDQISLPSTGVPGTGGKYLTANADGETVHLVATKANQWSVFGFTGTWAAEP